MNQNYQEFLIRNWQKGDLGKAEPPCDRMAAAEVIKKVLIEYGLPWQPEEADLDVIEIEKFYLETGGEFWVVEQENKIVGTAAYSPISRGNNAVEIRKMYLLPTVRRKGLGQYLLTQLEEVINSKGFNEIWIETASVLEEAVILYEKNNYLPALGVETKRCDLVYYKKLS